MTAMQAMTSRPTRPRTPERGSDGADFSAQRADMRLDELSDIITAYNRVTENLQRSHESLRQQAGLKEGVLVAWAICHDGRKAFRHGQGMHSIEKVAPHQTVASPPIGIQTRRTTDVHSA